MHETAGSPISGKAGLGNRKPVIKQKSSSVGIPTIEAVRQEMSERPRLGDNVVASTPRSPAAWDWAARICIGKLGRSGRWLKKMTHAPAAASLNLMRAPKP